MILQRHHAACRSPTIAWPSAKISKIARTYSHQPREKAGARWALNNTYLLCLEQIATYKSMRQRHQQKRRGHKVTVLRGITEGQAFFRHYRTPWSCTIIYKLCMSYKEMTPATHAFRGIADYNVPLDLQVLINIFPTPTRHALIILSVEGYIHLAGWYNPGMEKRLLVCSRNILSAYPAYNWSEPCRKSLVDDAIRVRIAKTRSPIRGCADMRICANSGLGSTEFYRECRAIFAQPT